MVIVAIAGFVTGGGVWGYRMWRLSRFYAGAAQMHRAFEGSYLRHEAINLQRAHDVEKIRAEHPPNARALLSNLWAAQCRKDAEMATYCATLSSTFALIFMLRRRRQTCEKQLA
jgi:hypothetical protein